MISTRSNVPAPLPHALVRDAVAAALAEDLGLVGDVTTNATIPASATASAELRSRKHGIVCGLAFMREACLQMDARVQIATGIADGDAASPGAVVATITGPARAILTAERVGLNFMGRLSGIATLTRRYADAVAHTRAQVIDTRKTTPGLRAFEKYAVRCGGGANHRIGLFDAVLIKDNHIAVAGGVAAAIEAARQHAGHMVKIEIEVDTLDQLREVIGHRIDAVLLDNMSNDELREAVAIVGGACLTEASGGVSLETVAGIAETGVDLISVGALTHSAPVLDLGLDIGM